MAIKEIGRKWCASVGNYRKKFIIDSEEDVGNLPKCCTGSTAIVAEGGKTYIVNASGEWVAFGTASYNFAEGVSF